MSPSRYPVPFFFAALLVAAIALPVTPWAQTAELPEDFHGSEDRIKLYYAYAEFKMGNYPLAKLMWENTTGKGRGEAEFNLGNLYDMGKGVEKSRAAATEHYRLAAQLGSRAGAYQMGLMHFAAPDLVDREEATRWLAAAALEGDEDAQNLLKSMQEEQPDPLTEVRVALATGDYARARELLEPLAQDDKYRDRALTRLGWMYEAGMGVEADLARAAEYFTQAAELGNAEAMYAIAVMYLTGSGKPQDTARGEAWLQKSAARGYPRATSRLEEMSRG
jgi:TPR repeat protein